MAKAEKEYPINWPETLRFLRELGAEVETVERPKPHNDGEPVVVWRVILPVGEGYDEVVAFSDGTVVITSWESEDWWDKWRVSPDGEIEYCGIIDESRPLPVWVKLAEEME